MHHINQGLLTFFGLQASFEMTGLKRFVFNLYSICCDCSSTHKQQSEILYNC